MIKYPLNVTIDTNIFEANKFDFGTAEEQKEIGEKIEAYLKSKYPNWEKENLIYKR